MNRSASGSTGGSAGCACGCVAGTDATPQGDCGAATPLTRATKAAMMSRSSLVILALLASVPWPRAAVVWLKVASARATFNAHPALPPCRANALRCAAPTPDCHEHRSRPTSDLPGPDPDPAPFLGGAGVRDFAAVRHGDGCRHVSPGHHAARSWAEAVARRIRSAEPPPGRWPLRGEPEPARPLLPISGDHEAEPTGRAGAAARELPRDRARSLAARFPLRRRRLGEPHLGRLGPRLGGLVRRYGGRPVHLFPAGRRDSRHFAELRDDLRARTA